MFRDASNGARVMSRLLAALVQERRGDTQTNPILNQILDTVNPVHKTLNTMRLVAKTLNIHPVSKSVGDKFMDSAEDCANDLSAFQFKRW